MYSEKGVPSKAKFLADLVTGNSAYSSAGATVQRSHRFPMHLMIQIENMARLANVPVSLIINQLLEVGLDAVRQELPEDAAKQISIVRDEQLQMPTITESVEIASKRSSKVRVERPKKIIK